MELTINTASKRAYVQLKGTIDEAGAEELKTRIRQLHLDNLQELVFDFAAVKHIGSAGIGKLLLFYKDMAPRGGSLRIENASAPIFDLLTTLKLDTIFIISR